VIGLTVQEMRAIASAITASSDGELSWSLAWLEHNLRRSLGDPETH
jgi:hypothetical protein